MPGSSAAAEFKAVNPQMVIPALVEDDGNVLYQSMAIMEYLNEVHPEPPLLPADPRGRARVRALSLITVADSHPLIVPRVRNHLGATFNLDEDGKVTWVRHWFAAGLDAYESISPATRRPAPTATAIGDDGRLCLVSHAAGYRVFKGTLDKYPTVARIVGKCLEDDRFARAQPLRQPGAPASH